MFTATTIKQNVKSGYISTYVNNEVRNPKAYAATVMRNGDGLNRLISCVVYDNSPTPQVVAHVVR